jgi:hypothetical protein
MSYVDLNSIHNPSSSAAPPPAWGDAVRDNFELHEDLLTGAAAFTVGTWIPTISQGASSDIAKTTTDARYVRIGNVVFAWIYLAPVAGGSAGSPVLITLPVTASSSMAVDDVIGSAMAFDNSAQTIDTGVAKLFTGRTQAAMMVGEGTNNYWGATPNLAVASGDQFQMQLVYLAA